MATCTACRVGSDRDYNIWGSTCVSTYMGVEVNKNNRDKHGYIEEHQVHLHCRRLSENSDTGPREVL